MKNTIYGISCHECYLSISVENFKMIRLLFMKIGPIYMCTLISVVKCTYKMADWVIMWFLWKMNKIYQQPIHWLLAFGRRLAWVICTNFRYLHTFVTNDFPQFSLVTDVWHQRFIRIFAFDKRLAAVIYSTFCCCQTSVNSIVLKRYLGEHPFDRYQFRSLHHCGLEWIPETNCIREEAVFIISTGTAETSVSDEIVSVWMQVQ